MAYVLKDSASPQAPKLDLLAHGLPGTQKTLSIGRFAQAGLYPFVIACDPGGMTTLKGISVPFAECSSPLDVISVIKDIHSGKIDMRRHGMICIDGATELSYMCLKATGESANDRRLDYTNYWMGFRRIIDEVRRMPQHVYINCLSTQLKNDGNRWGAGIEGAKYSVQFTGLFNTVAAMRHINDGAVNPQTGSPVANVYIQLQDDGIYNCKDRTMSCNMFEQDLSVVAQKILTNPNNQQ